MIRNFVLLIGLAALAAAQAPAGNNLAIGQKMKQNAEALTHYTYKRRTEIKPKDKSPGARVELVRYVDGKMVATPLETPSRPAQPGGGRGLRGMMIQKKIEKKKEEMKEEKERLTALLHSYLSFDSGSPHSLLEKAAISRTGAGPDADVKFVVSGMVKPGDSFTMVWSVAQHRPAQIDIRADLDGKPVRLTIDYASVPDGPFYPAHTVISVPKKDLTITVDSFDFNLAGG